MMKVSFPEIDAAYLRSKVELGYFTSVSEAIRDAVRKRRESEHSLLLAALEEGEKAIREGRVEILTRELFDQITEEGIRDAENGVFLNNPDVLPQQKHATCPYQSGAE